jgi:tetratricopeptide (TPR) repeat protein
MRHGKHSSMSLVGVGLFASAMLACSAPQTPQSASDATPAGHGAHGASGPTGAPPARTTLLGNLGQYSRIITTTTPEAQRFFDEGLTLLYGFNHEEAFRSFARAAALDARAPMPHWGMSLALGTNYNDTATPDRLQQAFKHLEAARALAANGSDVERAFVDALAKRYVATPDDGQQAAREQAYSKAMGEVSRRFPEDLDAATLYAESMMNLRPWKLYSLDGVPQPGTAEIVATLENVVARNPNHPGANHYYIHAVEASTTPDRAVPNAKRLETLVPGAGHLVHMPAHIYQRTGDYLAAAKSNADAAVIDEQYVKATGATGMYPLMYYGHNLQFQSASAMMAGNYTEAREAARKTATLVEPLASDVMMLEPFALQEAIVNARFAKWADVLAAPPPPANRLLQTALAHYLRGVAHAEQGHVVDAAGEMQAFEKAAGALPKDAMFSLVNRTAPVLDVARLDLTARIAWAKQDRAGAAASWTKAIAAEDALFYNEPADWLLPERETLGTALMNAGRAAEAEKIFRADLERNRQNPRSLFGVWKSLEQRGRTADAAKARKEFEAAWRGADVTLVAAAR